MKVKCVDKDGFTVGSQSMKPNEERDIKPGPFLTTGLHFGALVPVKEAAPATDEADTGTAEGKATKKK